MKRLFWLIGGLILIPALIYATDYTGTATGPELDYVHGVTSGVQAQINAKLAAATFNNNSSSYLRKTGSQANTTGVGGAVTTALNLKAPLASPTFTGTPQVGAGTPFAGSIFAGFGNISGSTQFTIQNTSTKGSASVDYITGINGSTNTGGTPATGYIDFGQNGPNYGGQVGYTALGPYDGYLYASDANLGIGTNGATSAAALKFFTGGQATSNVRMNIDYQGNITFPYSGTLLLPPATSNAVEYSNGTCTTAKTISAANGNHQSVTLTAGDACVLTLTGPASGTSTVTLRIIQASTATGTISTNSLCYWVGTVPTITTSSGAQDFISIYFFGGTYPACSTIGQNVTLQ